MFNLPFLKLWSNAFFSNKLPKTVTINEVQAAKDEDRSHGKNRPRARVLSGVPAAKRAAKKRKGVAMNKARHTG